MWKFTQRSWVGGRLDAELMGRQDLAKYFQGASEIKNFLVRRQGNLSKRRGTDLVCDLEHLLGYTETTSGGTTTRTDNAIGVSRLIPIVYEKEQGFYILVTLGRAFIVSASGVLLRNGEWTRCVGTYELTDYRTETLSDTYAVSLADAEAKADSLGWTYATSGSVTTFTAPDGATVAGTWTTPASGSVASVVDANGRVIDMDTGDKMDVGEYRIERVATYASGAWTLLDSPVVVSDDVRPYYAAVPYSDTALKELNVCQSGDTIFLAHRDYAPLKIVHDDRLTVETVSFSSRRWARPRIINIAAGSDSQFGSGALKTVYYVCTYVKDGVESAPSVEYAYAYKTPWADTCTLSIECDKGANEEEPDYYNIYKKQSTEFGLIATLGGENTVEANATIATVGGATPTQLPTWETGAQRGLDYIDSDSYLNKDPEYIGIGMGYVSGVYRPRLVGGLAGSDGLYIDLGDRSGEIITAVTIGLNTYSGTSYSPASFKTASSAIRWSGKTIRVTCVAEKLGTDGAVTETHNFTKIIQRVNTYGCSVGVNYTSSDSNYSGFIDGSKYHPLYSTSDFTAYSNYFGGDNITANFASELDEYYGTKTSTASARAQRFQVRGFKIETFEDWDGTGTEPTKTTTYIHSLRFKTSWSTNKTFEDNYITPDMTTTPPSADSHFDGLGDYPGCVAIYQQRLCFASSDNDPFKFWMSCVGDLYNFDTHSAIREDDALSATLAATEFPKINHMVMNRDLMLFADSGEWQVAPVSGNSLTYKTVSSKMQSAIGCSSSVAPVCVGDEIVFVKSTGDAMLATRYNFTSDGYESNDLTVLSQWLFRNNSIVQMAYRQHPDSTIECVLEDGTLASLVYMKEHEVCAWSRQILGGGWLAKGIATSKALSNGTTETLMLVERDGDWAIWKMRDDIPVRGDIEATDFLCMDGLHAVRSGEVIGEDMTSVTVDGTVYAGYVYAAELVTVRPEPQGSETVQFELKNAKTAEVRVLDSGDFTVRAMTAPSGYAQTCASGAVVNSDGTMTLASKDAKVALCGDNSGDGRVVVKSENYYPLNILSLSTDYEIQPLSGSAG